MSRPRKTEDELQIQLKSKTTMHSKTRMELEFFETALNAVIDQAKEVGHLTFDEIREIVLARMPEEEDSHEAGS